MASFSHADLIAALESQFDYLSARTIAGFVLKGAGLAEKAKYDKADADAVLAGLDAEAGGRADAIKDRLAAPAPAPAAKAPAAKAPAKAAAKEEAPAKEDAKAAPAKKAPAKKAPAKKPAAK